MEDGRPTDGRLANANLIKIFLFSKPPRSTFYEIIPHASALAPADNGSRTSFVIV